MKTKRNKTLKLYITNTLKIKYNSKQFKNIYFTIHCFYEQQKAMYPSYDEHKILNMYEDKYLKVDENMVLFI